MGLMLYYQQTVLLLLANYLPAFFPDCEVDNDMIIFSYESLNNEKIIDILEDYQEQQHASVHLTKAGFEYI